MNSPVVCMCPLVLVGSLQNWKRAYRQVPAPVEGNKFDFIGTEHKLLAQGLSCCVYAECLSQWSSNLVACKQNNK